MQCPTCGADVELYEPTGVVAGEAMASVALVPCDHAALLVDDELVPW